MKITARLTLAFVLCAGLASAQEPKTFDDFAKWLAKKPLTPTLQLPAAAATNQPVTQALTWSALGGSSFDVYLGTASTPPKVATVTATTYVATLQPSTKYYWKIAATNGAGTVTSATRTFTTAAAPVQPPIVVPPSQPPCTVSGYYPPLPCPPASSIRVHRGDDFLALLRQASPLSTFVLDNDFEQNIDGFEWRQPVTIRAATLPPDVQGHMPADYQGPRLYGGSTAFVPVTWQGIIFEGTRLDQNILIYIGAGGGTIDQCILRGSAQGEHRGLLANAPNLTVTRTRITGIIKTDQDTQAIGGYDNFKHFRGRWLYLEATGENIIVGGGDPSADDRYPEDIVIEDFTLTKPLTWMGKPMQVKNLLELKNVRGFTARRGVLEHCWQDAQAGRAIVLTVRNQDGTAPRSTIQDVLLEDLTVTGMGEGLAILAYDDTIRDGKPFLSERMARVTLNRVTFAGIDTSVYGGSGRVMLIQGGPKDLVLRDVTGSGVGTLNSAIAFSDFPFEAFGYPRVQAEGLIVERFTAPIGAYGIFGEGTGLGKPALDHYAPGYVWNGVTLTKGNGDDPGRWIEYPAGTTVR